MDAFDWLDVGLRVTPKRVASVATFAFLAALAMHFDPAWDLLNWAVAQRTHQLMEWVTGTIPPAATPTSLRPS